MHVSGVYMYRLDHTCHTLQRHAAGYSYMCSGNHALVKKELHRFCNTGVCDSVVEGLSGRSCGAAQLAPLSNNGAVQKMPDII